MTNSPKTQVRLTPADRELLARLAAERGMTLSEAMRAGAFQLLGAGEPPEYRRGPRGRRHDRK